ncbi:MAG TPA: META domain-containing protein [Nocardioides sp.]|uniref:META domain-containing protein n=1 Tax=uncultured Nocardioides sp. TaxID=198441 RepID=UPI000ED7D357|nr:META domain-containing protein [uncultured Nocardioides sp.]HCB04723.1 hypothetical protein [Nocardioides sp.]HRD61129.1 META domain-containing protein [Nocardioides sp.]HRI96178.1 META domain-containing protein [Nocardioides sp.]HRK44589.1 META domain-containing protein [Nocardioides sp.]
MSARILGAAAAAVLLFTLGACGSDDDSSASDPGSGSSASTPGGSAGATPPSQDELSGRTYEATSVEGYTLVPGTTLRVGFEDDSMVVRAGCNTMTAPYAFEGDVLKWTGPTAATMMACPPELEDQDKWVLDTFTNGLTASVDQFGANLVNDEVTIQLIRDDGGV